MPGETVAIVGESGSGKSTTALAAIGLLPNNGSVSGGQILLDGEDIAHATEQRMIELRGNTIGMVPQDPMSNLNPVWKIGYQVKETLRANGRPSGPDDIAKVLSEAGLLRMLTGARQAVPARILRRHAGSACADRHRSVVPAAAADRG